MMGSELHYVDIISFSLQRENQFIRIHSDLGKDHLTMLENSSMSHHPKNVISRKLSLSSRLSAVIVIDTVRGIESWWHRYGWMCSLAWETPCLLIYISVCCQRQADFSKTHYCGFFFHFTSEIFFLTLLLRKLEGFNFFPS